MDKTAIVGTTSWGTTLGILLANKNIEVTLLARTRGEAEELNRVRENKAFLPGIALPPGLGVTASTGEALEGAALVILATPSQTLRNNIHAIKSFLGKSHIILSAAKGIEVESLLRMSQVIAEEVPGDLRRNICVLSGPNIALEIARGLPAAAVVAAPYKKVREKVQQILGCSAFRVYTNEDVTGVELGGALKNIIALGAGMCDGLGLGDNTKAAFMTRGLAEIARLGVAMKARPLTFSGLAGVGDLIVTCSSKLSRNYSTGYRLATGQPLQEIIDSMRGVAEGVPTSIAAYRLSQKLRVEAPLTAVINRVLFEDLSPRDALSLMMERPAGKELTRGA
ncbi:MAG: NAD(P)H-dependent glycerol-3-phosphate dehydrogenase [Dehalococcoidia bacterium]|nr:NAD(P)H-dependent glycerol-3-phosphate dehydrogenase [Dehalococcoidia bacterium]